MPPICSAFQAPTFISQMKSLPLEIIVIDVEYVTFSILFIDVESSSVAGSWGSFLVKSDFISHLGNYGEKNFLACCLQDVLSYKTSSDAICNFVHISSTIKYFLLRFSVSYVVHTIGLEISL